MPPRKLRAIIFDIGRVLIGLDVRGPMTGLGSGLCAFARRRCGRPSKRTRDGSTGRKVACRRMTGTCIDQAPGLATEL